MVSVDVATELAVMAEITGGVLLGVVVTTGPPPPPSPPPPNVRGVMMGSDRGTMACEEVAEDCVVVVAVGATLGSATEPAPEDEHDALSAAILALVRGPTLPIGLMPCALWKAATAFCVTEPK
jgi:hypothetical protein